MKIEDIGLATRIDGLTTKEKTTVFIDTETGVELTTRVAS